jgi:hypothetical protein
MPSGVSVASTAGPTGLTTSGDLSSAHGAVELAKDVGAVMTTGGYIVVGVDDHGEPAGDVAHLELFDPAACTTSR